MCVFLMLGVPSVLSATPVTFTFDADAVGTLTSFTDTVGGLSATFSSSGDPGGFVVRPTILSAPESIGNVLYDPGPADLRNLVLFLTFSEDILSISMNFANSLFGDDSFTAQTMYLRAFQNGIPVGTAAAVGASVGHVLFQLEGVLSFSGDPFNQVQLSSTGWYFAIDNVAVTSNASVPEPGSMLLLGTGLCAIGHGVRRRVMLKERMAPRETGSRLVMCSGL
jgi:hypothetical protein